MRSNFFKVRDSNKFRDFCRKNGLMSVVRHGKKNVFGILGEGKLSGDDMSHLAKMLYEDEVAVIQDDGGFLAVNGDGKVETLDSHDIYEKAVQMTGVPEKITGLMA